MIRRENGKFVVYSEKGRKFGTYDTEEAANKRLRQMEAFKHMKTASMPTKPKLKSLFASEPKCIVHGAGKKCITGKLPSYKKAEYVFEKIAGPKTVYAIMAQIARKKSALKSLKQAIKHTSDAKGLEINMKREKLMRNQIENLEKMLKN